MISPKELERLEYLPRRMSLQKQAKIEDRGGYRRYRHGSDCYKIAERVLNFNIGKSFDLAFSYFCKKVKKHEQYVFFRSLNLDNYYGGWRNVYGYRIDENNLIRYEEYRYKSSPKTHTITSPDYKTEQVYVSDGIQVDSIKWKWGEQRRRKEIGDDIINKVISGTFVVYTFNDPRAVRDRAEKHQKNKKDWKEHLKKLKTTQYSFLTTAEQEQKAQKAIDLITRDRLGFDEESFKGIEYHGQKRKLKTND